jgi:hypothetical protein
MNWTRLCAAVVIAAAKGKPISETANLEGMLAQIETGETETAFLIARRDRFATTNASF